jgi:small subunit ribosomal protein S8e
MEPKKLRANRIMGSNLKHKLLSEEYVNLADPKTKKVTKAKITTVVENPANRNFVRRNILTKGTIVETEKGKARITSRPGQEGTVNAVLI